MKTIIIPTTQNIELEYPVAGLGERMLAGLLDFIVYIVYTLLIVYLINTTPPANESLGEYWYNQNAIFQIFTLPAAGYTFLMEFLFNGQTLGKMIMRMRTIRLDGKSTTLSNYLIRWMLRIIDVWFSFYLISLLSGGFGFFIPGLIGLICIGVTKNNQRLGDLAAGTTVVKLKLVTTFGDTIFVETDQDYEIKFPEIERLSDRDVSILKEVLDAGIKSSNPRLLQKLADKVKAVTQIETDMPPREFLQTLLQDYNHIFGRK
ncbi:MAG: RDD family protein [Bacteroidota bacterium]